MFPSISFHNLVELKTILQIILSTRILPIKGFYISKLAMKHYPPKISRTIRSILISRTWFCKKNCAWAGSCPAVAGFACWNIANCCNCCCSDWCCCWSVEASAWISWGLKAPREPCISNCWPTNWAARAAWELLLFCWLAVCCCCWWLPVIWLLTPELGDEALPLVPLLLFRCDTSVTLNIVLGNEIC